MPLQKLKEVEMIKRGTLLAACKTSCSSPIDLDQGTRVDVSSSIRQRLNLPALVEVRD